MVEKPTSVSVNGTHPTVADQPVCHPEPTPQPTVSETKKPWLAHYETGVPATIDPPHRSLIEILRDSAQTYADKIAIRMILKYLPFGLAIQSTLTYRELDQISDRVAAGLARLGVTPGDRVAIMLPNLPQNIVAYFGILKAGAIVVNTNPTYTPRELQHQLHDSGAETIITLSGLYKRVAQVRNNTALKHIILTDVPDTLRWPFRQLVARQVRASGMMTTVAPEKGVYRYADLEQTTAPPPSIDSSPEDVVLFQYSGGTTGLAKAAMLTNANLVANVAQCNAWFHRAEYGAEKMLGALPVFHVYGMTVGILYSLSCGMEVVIVPDPRSTELVLQVIEREGITLYPAVPAMYVALNNHPQVKEYELHSIKFCMSAGAALPMEVAQQFEALTGGQLVEGYGMTESSPLACANPIFGKRKSGSIGVPVSSTDMKVVSLSADKDGNYADQPVGTEGEIVIRGPQVMKGYWNQPEETESVIDRDGWLHTGDIGKMDEDGYFYVVDRKKDLIIASGYNIVPREVEEVLYMHDAVLEAVVIGVNHPKRGETVKAFVVLKSKGSTTAESLIDFCKEHLAPYKVPALVEFRESLPKSQIGKILRRVLSDEEDGKSSDIKT
ncbi:MAG: long-chain fatty acid--CoA ligase [Anaerolineae bacterium]|nr:long-chain fatty acid--CoA ligase [Anaerolineae bacterium]